MRYLATPLFLVHILVLEIYGGCNGEMGVGGGKGLLEVLQRLRQEILNSCERGYDGWGAEAVSNEREMCEVSLDGWLQDYLRPSVAQRRPVLVQQVHQFFGNLLGSENEVLASVLFCWVGVLTTQVLCYLPGWELCLTHVPKISCQVDGLAFNE